MSVAGLEARGFGPALRCVAEIHRVDVRDVAARGGTAPTRNARRALWAIMRDTGLSYPEIGKLTGHNDSTVYRALNQPPAGPFCAWCDSGKHLGLDCPDRGVALSDKAGQDV